MALKLGDSPGDQHGSYFRYKHVFKPGKNLNPISDEWGNIEVEGEVLANTLGKFGTWTVTGEAAGP